MVQLVPAVAVGVRVVAVVRRVGRQVDVRGEVHPTADLPTHVVRCVLKAFQVKACDDGKLAQRELLRRQLVCAAVIAADLCRVSEILLLHVAKSSVRY